jgi:hypothetical protein
MTHAASRRKHMNRLFALAFALLMASPVSAAEGDKLIGTWKLVSNNYEVQSTGQTGPTMGDNPIGYLHFTPEGRVFVVFSASNRQPGKTDAERAALLGSLTSYTGKYRVEGNTWTTDVDVAWVPEWIGTAQKRDFTLEGDTLKVMTQWRTMPNLADKGQTRGVLTFVKSK